MPECPECPYDGPLTTTGKVRKHRVPGSFDEARPTCPGSMTYYKHADAELPPEGPECDDSTGSPASSAECGPPSGAPPNRTNSSPSTTIQSSETETGSPSASAPSPSGARHVSVVIPGVDEYVQATDAARQQTFAQPRSLFDQPSRAGTSRVVTQAIPMSPKGLELAHRFKELFHAYTNRMERSQQPTMGPSEAGSPCDRRIAMSLLRFTPVNPGGDNWASWVGTQIHRGVEEMLLWADAGSGRYAPELKVEFPSVYVPKGTSDLLDRTLLMIVDWKAMGQWSRDKLKTEGPNVTYRTQAHLYGLGAKIKGEEVRDVAIVALPRDKSNLDDLYVWTEPYNPDIARKAMARVDRIGDRLTAFEPVTAYDFPITNTDCKYCPFLIKGAPRSEQGWCNGRA